jgi:DNA-binding PadR family transcriptional regulator
MEGRGTTTAPAQRLRARPRPVRITERDREVLTFVADHRLVLAGHVGALLGVSEGTAYARLHRLASADLLNQRTEFHQPACYQITRKGLAAIGSELPKPRGIDLSCYAHDVGIAWVWLGARAGAFGAVREVLSERQMRSWDARPDRETEPLAVRLGGFGAGGRERLHYPDLLLHTAEAHRVGVELELSGKGRARREKILSGYAADARIDGVLYLVRRPAVARQLRASASRLGISSLVRVQPVSWGPSLKALDRAAAPQRARVEQRGAEAVR